ncbi:hypothetical protein Pint_15460 [Pistacia integerrima]|uniref:Uncharacterized protein n=1 Tax=Pistacia integerrima TaxID=434235 RepID=A0ACC0ZAA0_9ROSI|nr:hypothetical protein Pint_15460 [Pistacia integerrima]
MKILITYDKEKETEVEEANTNTNKTATTPPPHQQQLMIALPTNIINTRNMFGGDSNNPMLLVFVGENRFQYNANALPQLQLLEMVSFHYHLWFISRIFFINLFGCSVGPLNCVGNERATTVDQQLKRSREPGCVLNPNLVSTGLRLLYEEDKHNSSVTSACDNVICNIPMLSLGDNLKVEIDRQKEELDHYIRL